MSKKKSLVIDEAPPAAYYRLTDDVHIANRWHLDEVVDERGDPPDLLGGARFEGASLSTKLHAGSEPLDFSLTSFAVPVLREKLARAMLAVAPKSIQLVPLTIPGHAGIEILNVLDVLDCLHQGQSYLEGVKDVPGHRQFIGVNVIHLDRDKLPAEAHIFRLKGWETAIYLSEKMKGAMDAAGCVGAKFSYN